MSVTERVREDDSTVNTVISGVYEDCGFNGVGVRSPRLWWDGKSGVLGVGGYRTSNAPHVTPVPL